MSKNNEWNENTTTDKGNLALIFVVVGLIVLIAIGASQNKNKTAEVTKQQSYDSSQMDVAKCKERIHDSTLYDVSKLNHIGNDGKGIIVTYRNSSGTVHKFKCTGSELKLYAKGAKSWIDF